MTRKVLVVLALLALVATTAAAWAASDEYEVTAVMRGGHPKLSEGSPVYVDGFAVGEITDIRPEDNKALITFTLTDDAAPLHSGAKVTVKWKSLVGERTLYVTDGPRENPEIAGGGLVKGDNPAPVEVSDALAALDGPTRKHLASFVARLNGTFEGKEQDLRQWVKDAGPMLSALGEVLRGVGEDGPAIESLVTNMNRMLATIGSRSADTRAVISDLSRTTGAVAGERQELRAALKKLPGTLQGAEATLRDVPETTDEAVPLLEDLTTATEPLPATSANLARLLGDLRPMVAELKPTLESVSALFDHTPALLDAAHGMLPGFDQAVQTYLPALEFLKPYTPEVVGFLTTWGSAGQNYDANGRYMRIHVQQGGSSLNANPGVPLPGFGQDLTPKPGAPGGIEQSDAEGEGMN